MPGPVALGGGVADILRGRAAAHAVVRDHVETGLGKRRDLFRIVGDEADLLDEIIACCRW
jgi:hypothetical protein